MPSPFPGMDPWLERPTLWPDVHLNLIIRLQNALVPLVSPKYYIEVRQRTVFDFLPPMPALSRPNLSATKSTNLTDRTKSAQKTLRESAVLAEPIIVEVPVREKITEDYLEVVEASTHVVIAVIEILSWSNKTPDRNRCVYERKRERIFKKPAHLVEIDLLRAGAPMPFSYLQANRRMTHYRIIIKRSTHWRRAYLYPFNLCDPIPIVPLPLQPGDIEPPIRLGEVLKQAYDEARYDLRVDYNRPPDPPLSDADAQWAAEILRAHKIEK